MEKQFSKYLKGTANPEEFTAVLEALCAQDSEDKVASELLELWRESLSEKIELKENSPLLDKIHYRIAQEESKSILRRVTLYRNLLKVAAVFILGLTVSTALLFRETHPEIDDTITENVTTPFGGRTNFKLPDGSEVWLNSGSTISFPRKYGSTRNVELSGQAYFQVVKDGKPFCVKTRYGKVEVMGTTFDVRSYNDENFTTTLVEGSVRVSDRSDRIVTLEPGQQAVLNLKNEFNLYIVDAKLITSWREGKLIFVNEPFANVARELERWYNVNIELKGEQLKRLGYTGTIELETFSEVLELINTTAPIKYEFNKNTRILKISGR